MMKKIGMVFLALMMTLMMAAAPAQANRAMSADSMANMTRLTFDIQCNNAAVCRIQNSDLAEMNGDLIWFYKQFSSDPADRFSGPISLEMADGSSRGYAYLGSDSGTFSLGRNGEGSLAHFMAFGTILPDTSGSASGTSIFHAEGAYINYQ